MQREQVGVQRIEVTRREHLVVCTYMRDDHHFKRNSFGSCGALIPYKPRSKCLSCGRTQGRAYATAPGPGDLVVDGDAALVDASTGHVIALQVVTAGTLANRIAHALARTKLWRDAKPTGGEARLSGIQSANINFGFIPPVPLRRRWTASRCVFDRKEPRAAALVNDFTREAERVFRLHAPEVYASTTQAVRDDIAPCWLIEGTPWTSGVINKTATLPYHRDSGNIKGSWSAMLGARHHVEGGFLHLADYDAWLTIPNGSISIFDGQSVLHGVTPLRRTAPHGYRYTLVTYAQAGMRSCAPSYAEEIARGRRRATEMEEARALR